MVFSTVALIESKDLDSVYAKPDEFKTKAVTYGTAGFRTKAKDLDWVLYRMGFLACLRSISQNCRYIGCMITASHNPEEDNGCKLVDPLGDMMEERWELYATELVNSNDLKATLKSLCQNELKKWIETHDKENASGQVKKPTILVGHDTRASSPALLKAFQTGVEMMEGILINYGLVTTPQLHYMVRCLNTDNAYGEAHEDGYNQKLARAFCNVWSLIQFNNNGKYENELYVDGANGIGALKVNNLYQTLLKVAEEEASLDQIAKVVDLHVFNEAKSPEDRLNHLCGADFVKVQQKAPINLPKGRSNVTKYCSFDGDADRIIYFYLDDENKFSMLDGDKIATLMATYLKELLDQAGLTSQISFTIVQTAYANGSSTHFIQNVMKIKASCTPTGVKHLHHEAQKYDVAVYFEANGHGTVLFSDQAERLIEQKYAEQIESRQLDKVNLRKWLKEDENKQLLSLYLLKHIKDCINQTVGDALSDMLVVELILASKQISVAEWNSMYTDLPCRQLKVCVQDRNVIKTTDAERRVSEPAELQNAIDRLVEQLGAASSARSFVRPSGTEDVVRVYAEANTQENADLLAKQVSQVVYDLAGGVGQRP